MKCKKTQPFEESKKPVALEAINKRFNEVFKMRDFSVKKGKSYVIT